MVIVLCPSRCAADLYRSRPHPVQLRVRRLISPNEGTVRKISRLPTTFLTAAGAAAGAAALVYSFHRLLNNPVPLEASIPVLLLAFVTYKKYFAKVEASTNHIEELSRLY